MARSRSYRGGVHRSAHAVLWALLCLAAAPGIGQAQEQWQLGVIPSVSSGTYGTDTRTDIVYTPFTARRLFRDGDLAVVLPYTCIRGTGNVTVIDGSPVRTDPSDRTGGSGTTGDVRPGRSTPSRDDRAGTGPVSSDRQHELPATRGSDPQPQTINTCGLGDIVVRGRYYVLDEDERGWLPTVAVRAHVKAPTASADAGLGTGRSDEGMGLEVSRMVGRGFMTMVDGGYTLIGKPLGVDFKNRWWYDVGVAQSLANGAANVSVFFEEYSAIVPGFVNARDLLAVLSLKSANGWRIQLLGEFGLSDGAPDLGVTIGASRRF